MCVFIFLCKGRRESNGGFVSKDIVGIPMVKAKSQIFWKLASEGQIAQYVGFLITKHRG